MKFAFIAAEKENFPIEFMCEQLDVSRSGYYASLTRGQSARARDDLKLAVEVAEAHERSRNRYGSPRVQQDLRAQGRRVSRKRVARHMREQGLAARQKRRFRRTTDSNHEFPIAPNLLARQFTASEPNLAWVTDITYVWTVEGWLYVAAIVDLFSRKVVGWATSEHIDTQLCLDALAMAVARRRPAPGLVHHSDRGSTYGSGDLPASSAGPEMACSMSRKADCWDNAVAESFWSTLRPNARNSRTTPRVPKPTAPCSRSSRVFTTP